MSGEQATASWVAGRTGVRPTSPPAERFSSESLIDEQSRPAAPEPDPEVEFTARGRSAGAHLIVVHDQYRAEMAEVRAALDAVRRGAAELGAVNARASDIGAARTALQTMALRANDWALGGYCQAQCLSLTQHHGMEDDGIFPHLRRSQPDLAPVLDRLGAEHLVIHDLLERIDDALVQLAQHPDDYAPISDAVDLLTDTITSHFAYEERELVAPLSRFGFYPGQL